MAVLNKWRFWDLFSFARAERRKRIDVPFVQPAPLENAREFADEFLIKPLTLAQLDELWHLDKRCFVNGEAYSRETLEYLLGEPNNLSYRAVLPSGSMAGFVISMHEEDGTGHITTIGVAPEHRRRGLGYSLIVKAENAYRQRGVRLMRLEVRTVNTGAQELYVRAGYSVTQRLPRYYSNGGDGLMMVKSLV
jgi:[ribosomal protein S18]-alanine N-acetyltransferase